MRPRGRRDRGEANREERWAPGSTELHRLARIEKLLAGEFVEQECFAYDFGGFHVGLVAFGSGTGRILQDAADSFDCRSLAVHLDERTLWAWLGGSRKIDTAAVAEALAAGGAIGATVALGESAEGIEGWRLTHRQAKAALPIAKRSDRPLLRYGEVALLASAVQDDVLTASLRNLYIDPLDATDDDRGDVARQTLRAYLSANRNVSSAAAALGVTRQTVNNRLRSIEGALRRPLTSCVAEVESALRLESLGAFDAARRESSPPRH